MSLLAVQGGATGTGTVTLLAPVTNTNRTLTLPDGTGTFSVAGVNSNIVAGTAVASTSGTSIDFTSIPSWVKRITVMFKAVSTSGTSPLQIQIGSGSVQTSGYASSYWFGSTGSNVITSGFAVTPTLAAYYIDGIATIVNFGSNSWVFSSISNLLVNTNIGSQAVGDTALSGTLDRIRITTQNGTDTFDAGSINILYE
jgi:hypothetical protein